jgi:hypothetical protein
MFENIIQKIKTKLEANTLIQTVYTYERADGLGTPFATVTPSANESDYHSTTENRRIYAFNIRLFVERAGQSTEITADTTMRALVDSVLDDFDSDWALTGTTTKSGYSLLYTRATPSVWAYAGREMEYRVAEIKLQAVVLIDTTVV